jgi:hypothetical protein
LAAKARGAFLRTATPVKVRAASETRPYSSWMGRLPMQHCRQSDGNSKVEWEAMPRSNADGEALFEFPVGLGFVSQPEGAFELQINGTPALNFDATTADEVWESADGSVRANYMVMDRNAEDSSGILRLRVKRGLKPREPVNFVVKGSAANSQRWFGIYEVGEGQSARR